MLVSAVAPYRPIRAQAISNPLNPANSQSKWRFDVAYITPSKSSNAGFLKASPGVLVMSGMTVRDLISFSYMLRDFQIDGYPRWATAERYDINAKDTSIYSHANEAEPVGASDPNRYRLRSLLADRFHLVSHISKEQRPVYLLTISDPTKLHGFQCPSWPQYSLNKNHVRGQMRLSSVAAEISVDMDRLVLDGTRSDMCYDLDLAWTDDLNNDSTSNSGPSIFTALHDIGLKLLPKKELVPILVVDHVERPSPN